MAVEVNPAKTSALGSRPPHVAILHHETCFEKLIVCGWWRKLILEILIKDTCDK